MRFTQTLLRQHIGFFFKKHWHIQGKRVPTDTGAEAELLSRGISVVRPKELLSEKITFTKFEIVGAYEKPIKFDETHPNWHSEPCFLYRDSNVLLEGVPQAQVLLNTVVYNELPSNIEERLAKVQIPTHADKAMQQSVMASHVFDTEQVKLPKIRDPLRPAHKFSRVYGISDERRNQLMVSKFITACERLAPKITVSGRKVINDAFFVVPIIKNNELIQFELHANTFMTSNKPLNSLIPRNEQNEIPDIFPLKETVTIPMENIYVQREEYPIYSHNQFSNPHTVFIHFTPENVKNLHETEITQTQFDSRALITAFTAAAAKARQQYGDDVKNLPKPVTVQSIQANRGKSFHFSVFQLNSLDLSTENSLKNVWYSKPMIDLFGECGYQIGKPVLHGYNKDVLKHFHVFYNNN